jgi:hypothetical protein
MTYEQFAAENKLSMEWAEMPNFMSKTGGYHYHVSLQLAGKPHLPSCGNFVFPFSKGRAHVGYLDGNNKWQLLSGKELVLWERGVRDVGRLLRAKKIPPQIGEVLYCLAMDIRSYLDNDTPEDFKREFGFDDNTTYEACRGVYFAMRKLLGRDKLQTLLQCEEE